MPEPLSDAKEHYFAVFGKSKAEQQESEKPADATRRGPMARLVLDIYRRATFHLALRDEMPNLFVAQLLLKVCGMTKLHWHQTVVGSDAEQNRVLMRLCRCSQSP